jgi:hypothetical protein
MEVNNSCKLKSKEGILEESFEKIMTVLFTDLIQFWQWKRFETKLLHLLQI